VILYRPQLGIHLSAEPKAWSIWLCQIDPKRFILHEQSPAIKLLHLQAVPANGDSPFGRAEGAVNLAGAKLTQSDSICINKLNRYCRFASHDIPYNQGDKQSTAWTVSF
jgi:hypothetical protein